MIFRHKGLTAPAADALPNGHGALNYTYGEAFDMFYRGVRPMAGSVGMRRQFMTHSFERRAGDGSISQNVSVPRVKPLKSVSDAVVRGRSGKRRSSDMSTAVPRVNVIKVQRSLRAMDRGDLQTAAKLLSSGVDEGCSDQTKCAYFSLFFPS
jgi:hypothetical protein